jgi:hypothetical protein
MKTKVKKAILFFGLILISAMFSGCKNDDPSVLKIFVRSSSNELVNGAQVVIVGDVNSNPATLAYVDTLATNASGFVEFNMDNYFSLVGEGNKTGYFDVIVKYDLKTGTEYVRCRSHITTVETVYLMN